MTLKKVWSVKEGEDFDSAVTLCEGVSLEKAVDAVANSLRETDKKRAQYEQSRVPTAASYKPENGNK